MTRYRLLFLITLLPFLFIMPRSTAARQATPATGCDIAPRTTDELGALATSTSPTPAATPALAAPAGTPIGEPVNVATIAELQQTLQLTTNCADAHDLLRLLALYSDRFIVEQVLRPEPAPIVHATPAATPSYIVKIPSPVGAEPEVEQAYRLPDGRIWALVRTGNRMEVIVFVRDTQRDLWQIDDITSVVPSATPSSSPSPSPIAGQPAEAQKALADAAAHLGVNAETLTVTQVKAKQWPDASLGCPQPGQFYAQVVTPGYLILIRGDGHELEYHADQRGTIVLCHER
jgi:hypothetical protein